MDIIFVNYFTRTSFYIRLSASWKFLTILYILRNLPLMIQLHLKSTLLAVLRMFAISFR